MLGSPGYAISYPHPGLLPKEWKIAYVTPLYKKKRRKHVDNYRPISLTSQVCKAFESTNLDEMIEIFFEDILFDSQHGFVPGKSCVTQLMQIL